MAQQHEAIAEAEQRIAVHEAVCAERYKGIQEALSTGERRMQRIEYIIYFLIGTVLLGPGFAAKFIEMIVSK
ncbi:hypothetical protein [Pandoraea sp. SD6-2]|uniref:hypothetical protein n=1 Tax=Pandoraea sp. SD6-2 TaxID=1286093 RepID=UPI0003309546|nr:hypothetical protein [Pandoraea sp. SD6-2]EON10618.1 hypothetical protein C266_25370 [Pandoraea sp. SD6-2]